MAEKETIVAQPVGRISQTLVDDIVRELAAVNETHHLWLRTRTELDYDDERLRIVVTIPDDDPFEPTRLARIFDTIESVIVAHMPHDLQVHEDDEAWVVLVKVPSGADIMRSKAARRLPAERRATRTTSGHPPARKTVAAIP
jgi:hypothetical protein